MNELKVFNYLNNEVRTIIVNDTVWFVASDIAKILEYRMASDMTRNLDDDEKDTQIVRTPSGEQKMTVINESGLYSAILRSRKEEAKKFKKWVTSEVLPTIRKTGGYVANEDLFINTYLPFADEHTKLLFRTTLDTVRKQNELIAAQQKQIEQQQKEIEHKENVIIGLVDEIDLATKRQILNRVVRNAGTHNIGKRWSELYKQFEMKYHIDLNKRLDTYNRTHKPKLKNKLDYIDKVLNKVPELYEIACKLYENDVKQLVKELYELNGKKL